MLYFFPVIMAIISSVFYHFIQKSTPHNVNPILSLIITYLTATVASIIVLFFYPKNAPLGQALKDLNWTSYALGIAITSLELGYLLAYRAGWNLNLVALLANTTVAIILIPIGFLLFRESLSTINILGIILCLVGIVLINLK